MTTKMSKEEKLQNILKEQLKKAVKDKKTSDEENAVEITPEIVEDIINDNELIITEKPFKYKSPYSINITEQENDFYQYEQTLSGAQIRFKSKNGSWGKWIILASSGYMGGGGGNFSSYNSNVEVNDNFYELNYIDSHIFATQNSTNANMVDIDIDESIWGITNHFTEVNGELQSDIKGYFPQIRTDSGTISLDEAILIKSNTDGIYTVDIARDRNNLVLHSHYTYSNGSDTPRSTIINDAIEKDIQLVADTQQNYSGWQQTTFDVSTRDGLIWYGNVVIPKEAGIGKFGIKRTDEYGIPYVSEYEHEFSESDVDNETLIPLSNDIKLYNNETVWMYHSEIMLAGTGIGTEFIPFIKAYEGEFREKNISLDNPIEFSGSYTHNEEAIYLVDTTSEIAEITIPYGNSNSFMVRDSKKEFKEYSCFVYVKDESGTTIHSAELDKNDKSYYFFYDGTNWNYSEEGHGAVVAVASNHESIIDFPEYGMPAPRLVAHLSTNYTILESEQVIAFDTTDVSTDISCSTGVVTFSRSGYYCGSAKLFINVTGNQIMNVWIEYKVLGGDWQIYLGNTMSQIIATVDGLRLIDLNSSGVFNAGDQIRLKIKKITSGNSAILESRTASVDLGTVTQHSAMISMIRNCSQTS